MKQIILKTSLKLVIFRLLSVSAKNNKLNTRWNSIAANPSWISWSSKNNTNERPRERGRERAEEHEPAKVGFPSNTSTRRKQRVAFLPSIVVSQNFKDSPLLSLHCDFVYAMEKILCHRG